MSSLRELSPSRPSGPIGVSELTPYRWVTDNSQLRKVADELTSCNQFLKRTAAGNFEAAPITATG